MADYAHTETDKRIEAIEKRLQAEYRQAYKETKGKLEKYLSDFARKDEAKRKLVDKGKLSQTDYKKWRTNQMLTGQRWVKMVDTLARDMNKTNQIAADIISGQLSPTFVLNANYAAYGIENGFRTDFGFTLYSKDTVNRLVAENPDLLPAPSVDIPADIRWNKQKITSNITQAVLQGKSIPEIAKTMQTVVGMNKASATRNARTAMTGAQNAGRQQAYDRAKAMGIKVKKEWVATLDGRTRHSHGMADGQQVEIGGKFKVGASQLRYPGDPQGAAEEVYNCRCTMVTVEPPNITKGEEPRKNYDEWIAKKGGKEYKKYQGKKAQVQKAMAKKQAEAPQTTAFTPAKTTEEAQQYADRFVSAYKSSLTGQVDYGGIQLSYANEMNRAFTEVFDAYDIPHPLRNIKPFNTREKRFKGTTAEAAYQWGINDIFYNKAYYKSTKAFNDHLAEYNKLLQTVLPNIDTAIVRTKPGASLRYLEALKRTGRTNVFAPDAYGSTIHEMGHYLDDQIFRKAFREKGFDLSASFEKYSGGISGYATATQQEYIAESFAAYWKGETDILDPDLVDIFKELRKK